MPLLRIVAVTFMAVLFSSSLSGSMHAAGDLTRQPPVDLTIELSNAAGEPKFTPATVELETGKLYKLILRNPSPNRHYFSAPGLVSRAFTRKVQVMQGKEAVAEIYGTITRIEVAPGGTSEWWLVPLATGKFEYHCDGRKDGVPNKDRGMLGQGEIK